MSFNQWGTAEYTSSSIFTSAPNTVTPRTGLAIAQVTSFTVLLIVVIYLIGRDGSYSQIYRSNPIAPYSWIPLLIFCILEILGGALCITTIGNSSPATDAIGSAVCFTLNLPLLLTAMLELLLRVNHYAARRNYDDSLLIIFVRIEELVLFVAMILYLVGGVQAGNVYRQTYLQYFPAASILQKVATIMTVVIFGFFFFGNISIAFLNANKLFIREHAILVSILLSTPLMLVRLVFAVLSNIIGEAQANPIYGDLGLRVGLGFVMEMLITIILVVGGLVNLAARRRRLRGRRVGYGTSAASTEESSSRGTESSATETTETSGSFDVYETVRGSRR